MAPANKPLPDLLAKVERTCEELQGRFGDSLRAARLGCGLKQSEVAGRTGLTQQYISLIEAGQQNITLRTMVLLAEIVECSVAEMLNPAVPVNRSIERM